MKEAKLVAVVNDDILKTEFPSKRRDREKLWNESVEQAKQYLRYSHDMKMKVAALAIQCCDRHHGGRALKSRYTLKNFAKEIGIAYGTLHGWIRYKLIAIDNIPKKYHDQGADFIKAVVTGFSEDTPKKEILARAVELSKQTEEDLRMRKYLTHLKTVLYNSKRLPLLKKVDPSILSEMAHVCSEISYNLDKYIRDKK